MDDSTISSYVMIIGLYLLSALGLGIKIPRNIMEVGLGLHKGCMSHMVYIAIKIFKPLEEEN